MSNTLTIRKAQPDDITQIRQFVLELAIYEKAEHEVGHQKAICIRPCLAKELLRTA